MTQLLLFDIAPGPEGTSVLLAVVLLGMGFVVLFAGGLVVFLWYRKRSLRGVEMIRPNTLPTGRHAHPSNPNQL